MIRIKDVFRDNQGKIEEFRMILTSKSIESFKKILDRSLNCWPDAPNEWKELSDILNHGKSLQPYSKMYPEIDDVEDIPENPENPT